MKMEKGEQPLFPVCEGCGRSLIGEDVYKVHDGSGVMVLCEECHDECVGFSGGDGFETDS